MIYALEPGQTTAYDNVMVTGRKRAYVPRKPGASPSPICPGRLVPVFVCHYKSARRKVNPYPSGSKHLIFIVHRHLVAMSIEIECRSHSSGHATCWRAQSTQVLITLCLIPRTREVRRRTSTWGVFHRTPLHINRSLIPLARVS